MAAIHSLLNPMPESEPRTLQLPSPSPSTHNSELASPGHLRKKQKLCKDAAVFVKGNIHGECRYPAYEDHDERLEVHQRQHEIHPLGRIMEYPRHVPYNSEKKSFLERTHRDGFEVFHYEFRVQGDNKVHTMMWDYNIGLVRTTPLFKCTGYSKTTPAKMLNRNPGLREICHSITGGALVAQGYWMPFEAAKAVAATFCWSIRHALTPVFGRDFPKLCLRPETEGFGAMVIDPAITRRCTEQAELYRQLEVRASSGASSAMRSSFTPDSPTLAQQVKRLRPKANQFAETASGYNSDSSLGDNYSSTSASPTIPYCNTWTPANTPRSVGPWFNSNNANKNNRLPSPRQILAGLPAETVEEGEGDHKSADSSSMSSTTSLLLKSPQRHSENEEQDDDGAGSPSESSVAVSNQHYASRHGVGSGPVMSDEKAAYLLLKLNMEACLHETRQAERRRASA